MDELGIKFFTFDKQVNQNWQSILYDYKCKVKLVIFEVEDVSMKSKTQENTLRKIKVEQVGPFIVYKRELDDKIFIFDTRTERNVEAISLVNMLYEEEDRKYVNFFKVPKLPYQSIKQRRTEDSRVYYENLLQVTILNKTFIFDLDDKNAELMFVHDMEQIAQTDSFVNIGAVHSTVERLGKDKAKRNTIITNEQATLYFGEEEIIPPIKLAGLFKLAKKINTKSLPETPTVMPKRLGNSRSVFVPVAPPKMIETQKSNPEMTNRSLITRKVDYKTYSGTIFRTFSEVELLELKDITYALEEKFDIGYIDLETILSTYEGHTIFSIF